MYIVELILQIPKISVQHTISTLVQYEKYSQRNTGTGRTAYTYRVKWRHRWSRYNRHFVGIAWYRTNVWSWWAKIYRVLYTTFDMLVCENVCTITSLPTKRISAISQWKTFVRVLPTRWRRKPAGTEMTSLSPYVYCLSVIHKLFNLSGEICISEDRSAGRMEYMTQSTILPVTSPNVHQS